MKYSEFHRLIKEAKVVGFMSVQKEAITYMRKDGRRYPVPYHGAKETGEGLRKKIMKDMGL